MIYLESVNPENLRWIPIPFELAAPNTGLVDLVDVSIKKDIIVFWAKSTFYYDNNGKTTHLSPEQIERENISINFSIKERTLPIEMDRPPVKRKGFVNIFAWQEMFSAPNFQGWFIKANSTLEINVRTEKAGNVDTINYPLIGEIILGVYEE